MSESIFLFDGPQFLPIGGKGAVVSGWVAKARMPKLEIKKGDVIEFRREDQIVASSKVKSVEIFRLSPPPPPNGWPVGIFLADPIQTSALADTEVWWAPAK